MLFLRETNVALSANLDALNIYSKCNGLAHVFWRLLCHTTCRGDFESYLVSPKLKTNMATRRPTKRPQSGLQILLNSRTSLTVLNRMLPTPQLRFPLDIEQSMGAKPTMPLHAPRIRMEHMMRRSSQAETGHYRKPWRWIATLSEA